MSTPRDPSNEDLLGDIVDALHQLGAADTPITTPGRIAAGYRLLLEAMERHGFRVVRGTAVMETWRTGPASSNWVDEEAFWPGAPAATSVEGAYSIIRVHEARVLEVTLDEDLGVWNASVDGHQVAMAGSQAEAMGLAERRAHDA